MSSTDKIGNIEAIFLILTIMINHIILNLPKSLISFSGSATILNILFMIIIILLLTYLVCSLLKHFPGLDILDISDFLGGKKLKYTIGALFMIYFLFTGGIFLRSFCESVKIIYFQGTPVIYLIVLLIIGIILCNRLGTKAIIKANFIFMPIILFSIFFIFFANIENLNIQQIFPILGNGISPTFFSGISNLFSFSGFALLYFLPPNLKDLKQFHKVAFTSMVLSGIWLLFSIATLLFLFPSVAITKEIVPLYLAARFIEFGRFFQRLDTIFLLIWIISMVSYLSIIVAFISNIFKKLTNFKYQYITIYAFSALLFITSLIPKNSAEIHFLETTVYKYIVLFFVFGISLLVLIFATIKYRKQCKLKGDVLID